MGQHGLLTTGRTEITALGDKVNEAARIEACAMEGRTLASKQLLERLDETDAGALALVVEHLPHIPLGGCLTCRTRRAATRQRSQSRTSDPVTFRGQRRGIGPARG